MTTIGFLYTTELVGEGAMMNFILKIQKDILKWDAYILAYFLILR